MDVTSWKQIAELVESISKSSAIIVGGWWAYRMLFVEATYEESIKVTMNIRVHHSDKPDF